MSVTSMDIPAELLTKAKKSTGLKTNREVVTYALEEILRRDRQDDVLTWMFERNPAEDLNNPMIKAQARS